MAEVQLRAISKTFASHPVLQQLDLVVADGELLGLVGPTGSGKSTLLRILAGLETASSGVVNIAEHAVHKVDRRQIALVRNDQRLHPRGTVRENLARSLRGSPLSKAARVSRVQAVTRQLRLDDVLHRKLGDLSDGQRQRVGLGTALVIEPEVLLIDEPFANLDAQLRGVMNRELRAWQQRVGATVVYVTYDIDEAMKIADRVAVMDQGSIRQVAPPAELYRSPANLDVAAFVGSPPMNLVAARIERRSQFTLAIVFGDVDVLSFSDGEEPDGLANALGRDVVVGVRPEHVVVNPSGDSLVARVTRIDHSGSGPIAHLKVEGLRCYVPDRRASGLPARHESMVATAVDRDHLPLVGDIVGMSFARRDLHVFDAQTGEAIAAYASSGV